MTRTLAGLTVATGVLLAGMGGCGVRPPAGRQVQETTPTHQVAPVPPAPAPATGSESGAAPVATGSDQQAVPATGSEQQAAPAQVPAPVSQKLSFDLFGQHKVYSHVTAEVGKDAQGEPQTTVRAVDGPNTLTMVVGGTGVGEHPVTAVTIQDEKLGGKAYTFRNDDARLSGKVTFTTFDPAGGQIAGTFTAAYKGFPPVAVRNGTVLAMGVEAPPSDGMATAAHL